MNRYKNKVFKTVLAALLALLVLTSCCSVAFAAAGDGAPVIYLMGRDQLYSGVSTDNPKILQYQSSATLTQIVREAAPYATSAIMFGEWDRYTNKTYKMLMDAFKDFPLNEDGEVVTDTGVINKWSENTIAKDYNNTDLKTYSYYYDCRLSPLEIADDFNDYVEAVMRVTGCKKVSLVGRCEGTNIMLAYLYKYQQRVNFRGIKSVVFYDSSVNGVDILDAAMSGTITFEEEALGNYLRNYDPNVNSETLAAMLALGLQLMQTSYGVNISASIAKNFYEKEKYTLFQKFLKNTYATCPGFWSMVNEHYDEAKAYIFSEPKDAYTYSRLIKKIDDYRYNVQLHAEDIILNMQAAGVHVASICKYGFQGYPLYEDAYRLSDDTTSLSRQSFGATCSKINATLGDSYIQKRKQSGYGDYISPDGQVDASTGLLPETTWYVKNCVHIDFPPCIDTLVFNICRRQINVFSNLFYPQFLVMQGYGSNKKIVPMTVSNCDPQNQLSGGGSSQSFLSRLAGFFRTLVNILGQIISLLGTANNN